MFVSKKSIARHAAIVGLLSAMVFGSVPAFAADNGVSQTVTAGAFTNGLLSADPAFADIASTHAEQLKNSTNSPTLTVDDATGENTGWSVTMISTALVVPVSLFSIPATAVSVQTLGTIGATNGGNATTVSKAGGVGALDEERTVLSAAAGTLAGTYTEDVTFRIAVPANVRTGAYAGTLTTTTARI